MSIVNYSDVIDVEAVRKELGEQLTVGMHFADRLELERWCIAHQSRWKGVIPEVIDYYAKLYGLG